MKALGCFALNIFVVSAAFISQSGLAQSSPVGGMSHPQGHPAQGYEVVAIVDKAERYRGARTRADVAQKKGQLISETGQTLSLFVLGEPDARGQRNWNLASVWDVSTGREVQYKVNVKDRENPGEKKTIDAQAATATGFFPVKMVKIDYVSMTYGEAMPYSVGYYPEFGTYIHQTRADWCNDFISTRRSAGCTRLCAEEAKSFFNLVVQAGKGKVLAYNESTGRPLRDPATGGWKYNEAYRTLVINTDSTPAAFRTGLLPVLKDRPVITIDPRRYIQNPQLVNEFFFGPNSEAAL